MSITSALVAYSEYVLYLHVTVHSLLGSGDDTRAWGPPWLKEGHSAYFPSINRNKMVGAFAQTVTVIIFSFCN